MTRCGHSPSTENCCSSTESECGPLINRKTGLYDPADEKDSCGVGMAVNINGAQDHGIVEYGLTILENLAHRGAENADGRTGDGSGITVQVPHEFILKCGIPVPDAGRYGTGILFLSKDPAESERELSVLKDECSRLGLFMIQVREVPVDHSVPGPLALETEPHIVQVFISSYDEQSALERKLFIVRKRVSNKVTDPYFYICSLSTRTLTYKGMLTPEQIRDYYADLTDPAFKSAIAMVHSRFSTNTNPMWKLAQPFRMLCHNGEINTINGNRSWISAREGILSVPGFSGENSVFPIVQPGMSDSASFDNVFEFFVRSGLSMANAITAMVPESWNNKNPIPDSLKAYYEYNSILMEPWDGPAALLFTDGVLAGGMLDRNGLRPERYTVTKDGLFILASESGVVPIADSDIKEAGRLAPGKMILIDTASGKIIYDPEIKSALAAAHPYRDWLEKYCLDLTTVSSGREVGRDLDNADRLEREFLYSKEDVEKIIIPMAQTMKEPVASSNSDIPLAALSDLPQLFYNYFKQSFAQVTNPPIDPIREELVMSLMGYIGSVHSSILEASADTCKTVKIRHPVLTNRELDLLRNLAYRGFTSVTIPIVFDISGKNDGLKGALDEICRKAEEAVDEGHSYIILSDRSVDATHASIPSLLALSAVHSHLVNRKKRSQTGLIVETGEAREVEHMALLFSYGATAVNPYLVFNIISKCCSEGKISYDPDTAEWRYIRSLEKGIEKVMSKMGIATIRSYRGSCLFEAVGLDQDFCGKYMSGTRSSIGGIGIEQIAEDSIARHESAFGDLSQDLPDYGYYAFHKGGERHAWSPEVVKILRSSAEDPSKFKVFAKDMECEAAQSFFVRDLMDFKHGTKVPLEEVESASSIVKRFVVEAMSFGAISKEAHETLAEAANTLGCKSNCGEGGEDPSRNGTSTRSKIRQVASGRFGVNADYLVHADELQIKVAQGAKPGEGGQLMGFKVDAVIAATRNTIPGITLISPPPHHDIYSIEDLKQLIFDLKSINPTAKISVKLVSESGVGTVACGVAKAGADLILISGGDGGTGAAPMSSMRYAGMPFDIGLAEVQQALVCNGLRGRVTLQADGQIKTGKDVILAALLGAEEYGFATAALISIGCIMCRKCQTNTCPVGIATQDPERRAKFKGKPEHLVNYFNCVAEEVRNYLSEMGFHTLDEVIGRPDLIVRRETPGRASMIDISKITVKAEGERMRSTGQADILKGVFDKRIISDVGASLDSGKRVDLQYSIRNVDRSVGTMLSGELIRRGCALKDDTINVRFNGSAGQSFGAFLCKGITFSIDGQCNDYVGKGLSGGKIAVYRSSDADLSCNVIAGNTLLYGATAGELYVAGAVGERFCVRNSGAIAVAEGVGDHCCEYMTGGRVVVLGSCGRNFAAGMSAGIAYVLNDSGDFDRHCNMDMVELELLSVRDKDELRTILENHVRYTGSKKAKELLDNWSENCSRFLKVMPIGYKQLLQARN